LIIRTLSECPLNGLVIVSPPTIKFIVMIVVMVASSAAGYVSRRQGWVSEAAGRPILLATLALGYPLIGTLPVWVLPLRTDDIWILAQCVLLTMSCFVVGLLVGRLHRLSRSDLGVYSYAAAHSNIGFTMGGFICFCLSGERALAYTLIYVLAWNVVMFAGFFPLAEVFSGRHVRLTIGMIARNLLDVPSLMLAGTILGLVLNLTHVRRPGIVDRSHIVDILVVLSTAAMFFIIGLTLHVDRLAEWTRLHVSLAAVKYVISPLLGVAWIAVGRLLGLNISGLQREVLVIQSAMPMAMFVTIVANLYGLNARLATGLFVVNTALFLVFVLPIIVFVYGG
jgi:predicted permease